MKCILLIACLLMSSEQTIFSKPLSLGQESSNNNSDWKLGTIYNESDLKLDSAWRHKHTNKKNHISSITKALQDTNSSQKATEIMYSISQRLGTMSILVKNKTQSYDIFFDSHATHSLEWKRGKTKEKITLSDNPGCAISDGQSCARVWMVRLPESADATPVAKAFHAYDTQEDEPMIIFDVKISGQNGSYVLSLLEHEE